MCEWKDERMESNEGQQKAWRQMMLKHKCIQEFKATRQNKQNDTTVTVQNVTPIKYIRSPKSNTAPEAGSKKTLKTYKSNTVVRKTSPDRPSLDSNEQRIRNNLTELILTTQRLCSERRFWTRRGRHRGPSATRSNKPQ